MAENQAHLNLKLILFTDENHTRRPTVTEVSILVPSKSHGDTQTFIFPLLCNDDGDFFRSTVKILIILLSNSINKKVMEGGQGAYVGDLTTWGPRQEDSKHLQPTE